MQNRGLIGILYLCVGVFVFSIQDAILKFISLTGSYPVTQAVAIRSLVALPILLVMVHFEAGIRALFTPRAGWLMLRALVLFISYTSYYLAFPALPLADAVALYFTVPLFVTALAVPFLGERANGLQWTAVIAGFAGVIIMLQPGRGVLEPAAFLSLLSAVMYAASMLMTRALGVSEKASVMGFYQNMVVLAGALAITGLSTVFGYHEGPHPSITFLVRAWEWPSLRDLVLMGSCGLVAASGMYALSQAYRVARASTVTPFEYTGILWVPLWGFLLFAEVPRLTTLIGAILIVGAGLVAVRVGKA
jgi:drug/metabolite transporter (DMT)-like permease